jgi:hypothetical protein
VHHLFFSLLTHKGGRDDSLLFWMHPRPLDSKGPLESEKDSVEQNMYPDWQTDLAIPTVGDRVFVGNKEITVDKPQSQTMRVSIGPARGAQPRSERAKAVATILARVHAATADFIEKSLNHHGTDVELLRVDFKNLLENHRSALEYVAHYIAAKCINPPQESKVQFPIANSSDNATTFIRKLDRWFPGIVIRNPALTAYLTEIQPFNSDQWLARLADLTNFNKHRSLSVWESAVFESLVMRCGEMGFRFGELGLQSIEIKSRGKIIFRTEFGLIELRGPRTIDLTTTSLPDCDPRITIERQELELHKVRDATHSIAHEIWIISRNVFRAVDMICHKLS